MMQYLATIAGTRPLAIHFSLYNPPESDGPVYVPRLLGPLGAFIGIEVMDAARTSVYQSKKPKLGLKLHPARAESYHILDPAYTYGIVLTVADLRLAPGDYQ